jgi:hypothetical protein
MSKNCYICGEWCGIGTITCGRCAEVTLRLSDFLQRGGKRAREAVENALAGRDMHVGLFEPMTTPKRSTP